MRLGAHPTFASIYIIHTEVGIHLEARPLTWIPVFTGMTNSPAVRIVNLKIRDALATRA
jgi:hypothetical protein